MHAFSIGSALSEEILICLSKYTNNMNIVHIDESEYTNIVEINSKIMNYEVDDNNSIFIFDALYDIMTMIDKTEVVNKLLKESGMPDFSGDFLNRRLSVIDNILINHPESKIFFIFPSYINYANVLIQKEIFNLYAKNKKIQKKYESFIINKFSENIFFIPSMLIKENMVKDKKPYFHDNLICAYAGMIYNAIA